MRLNKKIKNIFHVKNMLKKEIERLIHATVILDRS